MTQNWRTGPAFPYNNEECDRIGLPQIRHLEPTTGTDPHANTE